jgi:hypothetical protein
MPAPVVEALRAWVSRPLEDRPASSGRLDHSVISSTTRSVIRETVSVDTLAPQTSAKCALTSPVVRPARSETARPGRHCPDDAAAS